MHHLSKLPNVSETIFVKMSKMANENNAINLAQGFPDFPCDPYLIDLVNEAMKDGQNQYSNPIGIPSLRHSIAHLVNNCYNVDVNPESEITVTVGATEAIYCAISAFIYPGDEVIIIEPAYDCYEPAILVNGGKVVRDAMTAPDYQIDWDVVRKKVGENTKMIIVNTPHNPTGSVLDEEDFLQLDSIVADTGIIVLSDEVYEHLVFDQMPKRSILQYPAIKENGISVSSFGKTYHTTGWRMGYCIGAEKLTTEIRKVHQYNVYSTNTPLQVAFAKYLQDRSKYDTLPTFFQQKRDQFLDAMKPSQFVPLKSSGTYFQLFDYAHISDLNDVAFCEWLVIHKKVAAVPVSVFYENGHDQKVIRLCFAKSTATLDAAASRLCAV
ncbi:MAG: aminotransferase class I/II-fold pyridoxal phosphate-dependent enzyme [Cyclobacteriaceae bacterium]